MVNMCDKEENTTKVVQKYIYLLKSVFKDRPRTILFH